jgi:hypothetical protein
MTGKPQEGAEIQKIELYPGAWDRFRQAVHVMAKAGPQHRISGVTVKNDPKKKGRVRKGKSRS